MGRIRKEHALTWDMSSTDTAPVSPAGALRMRPKADGTTVQLSYNTGPYFDLGAAGAGAFPRLDQVLDPNIPATDPPTNRVKTFNMTDHSIAWGFTAAQDEECFVIGSAADALGGGSLLLLQTLGPLTNKAPLRVEGRGAFYLSVTPSGKVAIGSESGLQSRLSVYHTNSGGIEQDLGAIQGTVTLATGNAATSVTAVVFGLSDNGNTTALTQATTLALVNSQTSLAPANASRSLKLLDAGVFIAANTGLAQGLVVKPTVSNLAVLTAWEGIRVVAPNLVTGGVIENNKAIVTEAGSIDFTLRDSHLVTIYKTTDEETPQLDFKRTKATGDYLAHGDLAGRIMFYGWFSPGPYKALGYIQSTFDTTYGPAGTMTVGVGDFGNARIDMLQTDTGVGGVTIHGGATTPYLQIQTAGVQFSHGTTGSIYYKAGVSPDNGWFTNLDPVDPADEGKVLTLVRVPVTTGVLIPRWVVAPGASGGTPATPVGSLQYNNSGAFGSVTSSQVSGADVTLGGLLTVQSGLNKQVIINPSGADTLIRVIEYAASGSASPLLRFERATGTSGSPGNITAGDTAGKIEFQGQLAGSPTLLGYLYGGYDSTDGGVVALSTGQATPRTYLALGTATDTIVLQGYNGSTFSILSVTPSGTSLSGGSTNGVYFKNSSGYIVTTSAPPAFDRMLFWDTSANAYAWLEAGSGLTITDTVMSAAGGAPGTPVSTLQYNNAGAFGAVANSQVSVSGNVTLGGYFQLMDAASDQTQEFFISATTAAATRFIMRRYAGDNVAHYLQFDRGRGTKGSPSNLIDGDPIGEIRFYGYSSGLLQRAFIQGAWDTEDGGVIRIGAGPTPTSGTRFEATQNAGLGLWDAGGNSFTVGPAGFEFSHGSTGSLYYRNAFGLFTATAAAPAGDRIVMWDNGSGVITWMTVGSNLSIDAATNTLNATGGSTTPGGSTYDIQYRTATPSFGGITQTQGGLLMGTSGAPPYFTTTFWPGLRYTFSPNATTPGLNVGSVATGSNPSSPVNGDIYYNSTAGKFRAYQNSAWIELGASAAGSSTELQYRNSSTGALAAVASSSVDGAGVITVGSGNTIWKSNNSAQLSLKLYTSSTALTCPQISVLRSRGSEGAESAVLSGDALFVIPVYGQYTSGAAQRQGGELRFDATGNYSTSSAPTIFKLKTSHVNSIAPITRLVLGGSKNPLTDNTRTAIFSVTFDAADHQAVAGVVHFTVVAKQVSGSVQIQCYRVSVSFTAVHYGSSVGYGRWGNTYNTDGVTSTGSIAFTFDCNTINHPSYASGSNVYTFYITANSDLATISEMWIQYNIEYNGEKEIALL